MNSSEKQATEIPADLQQIAAEAAQLEAETAPAAISDPSAPDGSENEAPIDFQQEAVDLMDFVLAALDPFYPCLEKVYTPQKKEKLARALGKVMAKYNLTFLSFLGKWGPEIELIIVVFPLARETYKAIKAETAALEVKDTQPATPMQPIIDQTAPNALHTKV